MRHLLTIAFAFAVLTPAVLVAQRSQSGGTIVGGSNTTGQTGATSVRAGTSSQSSGRSFGGSAGQSGFGSMFSGNNSTGSGLGGSLGTGSNSGFGSSLGGSGTNGNGLGGSQNFQLGDLGQTIGTGPFIGRSDNLGRFVGNQFAGSGGAQAFPLQSFGNRGGGSRGNDRSQGGGDRERLPIRPTQRIAFDFTAATPAVASERVEARFADIVDRRPELSGLAVEADADGRIVLRGSVATQEAKELAAALVRLEPGVREVVNELVVAAGPAP